MIIKNVHYWFFFVKLVLSTYLLLPRYTENAFLVSFDLVLFVVRCMLFNYQLVQLPLCDSGRCSTSQKNHLMTNIYYTPVTIPPCHVMIIHNDVVVVCLKIGLWNYSSSSLNGNFMSHQKSFQIKGCFHLKMG